MKTSWKRCLAFNNLANGFQLNGQAVPGWLERHPKESKFHYAIKRVLSQIGKINAEMQIKFEDIDIDNAATDANQLILRNPDGSLAYTAEGLKARNKARRELLDREDLEIESHFCPKLPADLNEAEIEIFTGFVIKESEPAKLEAVPQSQVA